MEGGKKELVGVDVLLISDVVNGWKRTELECFLMVEILKQQVRILIEPIENAVHTNARSM